MRKNDITIGRRRSTGLTQPQTRILKTRPFRGNKTQNALIGTAAELKGNVLELLNKGPVHQDIDQAKELLRRPFEVEG